MLGKVGRLSTSICLLFISNRAFILSKNERLQKRRFTLDKPVILSIGILTSHNCIKGSSNNWFKKLFLTKNPRKLDAEPGLKKNYYKNSYQARTICQPKNKSPKLSRGQQLA